MLQEHRIPQGIYFILLALLAVVYILAMFVPVMEVDAAQYASISEQMLREDSFLIVKHREYDYLDKPPLLFWLSALSMKVLGVNSFAYKLPSVLALVIAIFSTYRYARLSHDRQTADTASLILASSLCFFLMSNDVRTDNLLIGFSMLAVWKIAAWLKNGLDRDLYIGFVAIGLAMLAKGPLGLVFTMFTIGTMLVFKAEYKKLSWKWLWGLPIVGLILTPMCIGLYQQHGLEGIEFFFWKQSFGRITGESEWSNNTDPFFLVHSFLWAFLPWPIFFLGLIFSGIKNLVKSGKSFPYDVGSFGGLLLTMLALSFSRYKLPHYIYIVAPLAAVLSAEYLNVFKTSRRIQVLSTAQLLLSTLFLLLVTILATLLYDWKMNISWLVFPVGLIGLAYTIKRFDVKSRIILASTWLMFCTGISLFSAFYPKLLEYQSLSEASFFINEQKKEGEHVIALHSYGHALPFYQKMHVPQYKTVDDVFKSGPGTWVYTNPAGLQEIKASGKPFTLKKEFPAYTVQFLKLDFLLPATRSKSLDVRYVLYLD